MTHSNKVEELSLRMRYGGRLDNAAQDNDTFEQGGASAGEDGDVSAGEDKEERSHHGVVSMALSCADKTYIVFAYLPSYYSWTFGGESRVHDKPHLHIDQAENVVCPSQDFWPIQCPCQQWSVSRRLKPRYGVNLVLLPVALIQTWLREIKKMFDKQPKTRFLLYVKIAWGVTEKNRRLR